MKLHLPKALTAALVAAVCAASTTVASATELNKVVTMSSLYGDASIQTATENTDWASSTAASGGVVYSFDGSDDYIGGINNTALNSALGSLNDGSKYVTFAAWVYLPDTKGDKCIFGYGGQNDGFKDMIQESTFKFTTKGKNDYATGNSISAGSWNLVALTVNKTSSNYHISYTVGDNMVTPGTNNDHPMAAANPATFAIGSGNSESARELFKGSIADFTVFTSDAAVTAAEIVSAMGAAPTLAGYTWHGTSDHHAWSDSVWNSGAPFVSGENAIFRNGEEDYKTVSVSSDTVAGAVTVDNAAYTFTLGANLTASKLTLNETGAALTINGTGTVNVANISASGKTITLDSGVTLQGISSASATLAGNGYVALADNVTSTSLAFDSGWTGTVRISNAGTDSSPVGNFQDVLSKLGNGTKGTVEISNIVAWLGNNVSTNIKLDGTGTTLRIVNGSSSKERVFSGAVSGTGDYEYAWAANNGWQTHTFTGDVSGWTGSFKTTVSGTTASNLKFSGSATDVKAGVVHNRKSVMELTFSNSNSVTMAGSVTKGDGSTLNLVIDAPSVTFSNSVNATALSIGAGKTATFNGTTTIDNGVTLGSGAKLVNGGTLTLGGTVTFGGNAIENNGGTVHFGNNLVFNLDGLTPGEVAGVHTYTLFSGSTSVDLSTLGVANITLTDGTSGKDWTFGTNGTISWTLPSELEWDNGQGTGKWNSTDTNWGGHAFVDGATAQFYVDANASITEPVRATSIVVGKAGEDAVTVAISAEETGTLTAGTLQVDNGSLTTNTTIEGLGSNTVAAGSSWHIAADQTIATGAIDGSVDVVQGKTVTLASATNAKDLLLGITGAGNIALGTNVSFNSSDDAAAASTKATGTLTLKEGVKLTVGNNKDKAASIASFNHVVMEQGAGIDTKSRLVEINNLTVNTDASHTDVIKMLDTYSKDEIGLNLKGTTTLNGNLEINSDWKYKVNIETLAGTGKLTLKGGSTEQHTASIGGGTVGGLELSSSLNLTVAGATALGDVSLGDSAVLNISQGVAATASSLSIRDNNKATLNINGTLDVSGNFYAIGCSNTTDIIGSGDGSSLTVGSLDICNFGTNFNLQNITMTVSGKANAGDDHNKNTTHIDLNAGSKLNLLGEVTFNTPENKYCTLNVNGGTLTAGIDAEGDTTRVFQDIVAGTNGGTVKFLNGENTVANLNMTAGDLTVTVGEHATLTVADATLKSTITGAVTLTGTVDITNHVISDRTDVYTGGETPGDVNGFRSSAGKMVVATGTVTDEGATYMFGGTDVTSDVVGGVYNVSTETDYTHFYINEGTETLSHAIAGATTLSSVVMSGGTLVADGQSVNLEIAEGAAVTLNVTEETTISSLSGTGSTLYITGDSVVTLAANSSMTSTIDIGGTATVKMGEHEALGNAANSITVHTGATLDINGKDAPAGKLYTLTLAGGTYANTGSELSWGSRQLVKALIVTDDSKVNAESHDFGLINGGYDPTTLDLGATLEKVGSKNFYIVNSTITGDGEFKVTEGGLFFNFNTPAERRGTLAADFLMNGGSVGGTIVLADDISVSAVAGGSTFNAAVINGGHTITFDGADDLTVGGVISGEGGIIKDGEGTLTLQGTQTYTGTTVVNGGKLVVEGTLADDSTISVEGDATIDGNVDTTQVGIAAGKTATFEQGISDASGVTFSSEEGGVDVKNTNAEGPAIKYSIDEENAKVTADELLLFTAEGGAEVKNLVAVGSVQNLYSEGALTLTNVDTSALHEVVALMGDVVLENVASVDLQQLTISGATVAVYVTDEQAETEGTVTITETLTSGGGTLLANLTVKGGSMLDMVDIDNKLATVTLGSELSFAEDGLVSLSDEVITLLNGMEVDGYWDIFQTYEGRNLDFVGDYDGAWFDSLFNRNGELVNVEGDFQIEATPDHFRLVKNSMVPEPTTGTLSLLALMALAARRRRK